MEPGGRNGFWGEGEGECWSGWRVWRGCEGCEGCGWRRNVDERGVASGSASGTGEGDVSRESGERSRDGEAAAGYDDENDGDFSFSGLAPTSVRPPLTLRLDVLIAMPWCPPSCSSDAVAAVEVEKRDWADVEMLPRAAPALPYAIAPMIACLSACGAWTMPLEMVCVGAARAPRAIRIRT